MWGHSCETQSGVDWDKNSALAFSVQTSPLHYQRTPRRSQQILQCLLSHITKESQGLKFTAIAINQSIFIHYSVKSPQKGWDETKGKNPEPNSGWVLPLPVGWTGEKERERQRDRDREIRTNRDNHNKIKIINTKIFNKEIIIIKLFSNLRQNKLHNKLTKSRWRSQIWWMTQAP